MRRIALEEELWKPREDVKNEDWNGFRNIWPLTDAKDGTHIRQSAGINPIARVNAPSGSARRPAIAVFMTPAGERNRLPWLDEVDLDTGFVRYFGDNRPELHKSAEQVPGNRELLREIELYSADDVERRAAAAPILFFRNLGSAEGEPLTQFLGFGLIKEAHRLTQLHKRQTFSNYAYDCVLFRGQESVTGDEQMDFAWIDDRRDSTLDHNASLKFAPLSWREWVKHGMAVLDSPKVRRYVQRAHLWDYQDQVPDPNSPLGKVLMQIYERYDGNYKHGFQALAAIVSKRVISEPGTEYAEGWVTPVGPDGGVDFVQRLDVGRGMSQTSLVVLGQAKCRKPWPQGGNGVNAEELARVVARLRRGWIGTYVTTSWFTDSAQREMHTDEYPIVLIPGLRVAQATEELRDAAGFAKLSGFFDWVDDQYLRLLRSARPKPADILRETPGRQLVEPDTPPTSVNL